MYFGSNAFIPIYLTSAGRSDLVSATLLALNFGQPPASGLLLLVAAKLERRTWPYVALGILALMSIVGLVAMPGLAAVWWAGLLGFSAGGALILGLTLPPLLCQADDVARTAAGMFTISYSGAVVIAIVSGAAWDLSGVPALSFLPLGACAVALVGVSVLMQQNGELR